MKNLFKKFIITIITIEAKLVLKKYRPKIVAVTGSVGKTSTKEAIVSVLAEDFYVRGNKGSYNSEIGVPLTVLGQKNAYYSFLGWLRIIFSGLELILERKNYPRILVLEFGADKPRDIQNLVSWIKPDISVLTALGNTPVHVEFFSGPEELRLEKSLILTSLSSSDRAILNYDDITVMELAEKTKAEITTFGFGRGSDFTASNYKLLVKRGKSGIVPEGITFKIDNKGASVPIRVYETFGRQQVYACLAAASVGAAMGLNLVKISGALSLYKSPPGRLKLIEGIKETFILDDTYNSSPVAAHAALDCLNDTPSERKIAVFGDMLELGQHTISAHTELGEIAASVCDMIFVVGIRAKFIKEGAASAGFPPENIFEFSDSAEAGAALQDIIKKGDAILIKGSQSMRMERAVEEIMARPEEKEQLLVRQDKFWLNKRS